jgi:hypothetical protein
MIGTPLLGLGASGMIGTPDFGRGASGIMGTPLFWLSANDIAMFVAATAASVITRDRKRLAVTDILNLH